ncbi:MAG: thiamine-monophosphate kinase [Bradymonadia bacterium]|jgi:thiamine-monophosphate kinase
MSESETIECLRSTLGPRLGLEGIGDDGALLRVEDGRAIVTDTSVEGVHFRREWSDFGDIAWRALATNISDMWAMRARPSSWLLSLSSPGLAVDELAELVSGFQSCISELQTPCDLVGGDTTRAPALILTVTVVGDVVGEPMSRATASPGDDVYINGRVGHAAAGLAALRAGRSEEFGSFVKAHRRPHPPQVCFNELARASAGMDVSDGLAQDLTRLARASAVSIAIDALPDDPDLARACSELSIGLRDCQLFGGDDYVLVVAAATTPGPGWRRIGTVEPAADLVLTEVMRDGTRRAVQAGGFQHFSD